MPPVNPAYEPGLKCLGHPVLPLYRIVQMLFLTGPFTTVLEVLEQLTEPIETNTATYADPQETLRPYLDIMSQMEALHDPGPEQRIILAANHEPLDSFSALDLWISQQVLTRELETINSLLCGPCGCTLCCTGPEPEMAQEFFEIPLQSSEINNFSLPRIDSAASRGHTAQSEPPLAHNGLPFYQEGSTLIHWQNGWSLILPKGAACPHLQPATGHCLIYPQRPQTCRRPQIFAYVLEAAPQHDRPIQGGPPLPAYIARNAILAVWDCPYVKEFKTEIAAYAEVCGLEPVFKENKG